MRLNSLPSAPSLTRKSFMTVTCKIDGCEKASKTRGYCIGHYTRVRNNKDLSTPLKESRFPRGSVKKWLEEHVSYVGVECLEFPFGRNGDGYGIVKLDGFATAHRWMCDRAHPNTKNNGPMALHSCGKGDLGCVNPNHLYWGTVQDNYLDAVAHGAAVHSPNPITLREYPTNGAKQAKAKLTEDEVIQIRAEYDRGVTGLRYLSRKYQVHRTTIRSLIRFETWKDVRSQP
jgi:hypothetical protein